MTASIDSDWRVQAEVAAHPYPLLFATVSGAHLYGFPSRDSDVDLRGVHILPPRELLGLDTGPLTIEVSHVRDRLDVDLVTHDAHKFFTLLLKRNGYVLEQLCSPLIVHTSAEHSELKSLVTGLLTKHHSHHYLGFATNQWHLFEKTEPRRVKPLLYVYRVLLTGLHLMRTGEVEANLWRLNETWRLTYLAELLARKMEGTERTQLDGTDLAFHEREYGRLIGELEQAREATSLPDVPSGREALNDLLLRIRFATPRV